VLNVHDTVYWDTPDALSTLGRHYYLPLVERAIRHRALRATFYLSAQARDAVLRHFPHLAPTARVTYCATPLPRAPGPRRFADRADGPLRILTVGTVEPRKNLPAMARAIERFAARTARPVRWLVVGRRGWATPDDDAALRIPQAEYLGGVDDAALLRLHAGADAYLSLSRLEGFNIPLLEAMGQGTPPVVSTLPVHREVGSDAATYVPAEDADAVASALQRVLGDADAWDAMSARAWARSAQFTVDAVARRVLEAYGDVA
jgi:glycosyltransferase involved in cell wall biosynthesis